MIRDQQLQSISPFLPSFFLLHAISDLHNLSTRSSLPNQRLRLIPALWPSGVSTLNYMIFPIWKSSRVEDLLTHVLKNQMVLMNYGSPAFGNSHISTHSNLWNEFPQSDKSSTTRTLQINDPDFLHDFRTLTSPLFLTKTRSMVLWPPLLWTIDISFRTSTLSPSAFLWSAPYSEF